MNAIAFREWITERGRCSNVPVVEGNSDCKSRWSANLTTCSSDTAVAAVCEALLQHSGAKNAISI